MFDGEIIDLTDDADFTPSDSAWPSFTYHDFEHVLSDDAIPFIDLVDSDEFDSDTDSDASCEPPTPPPTPRQTRR